MKILFVCHRFPYPADGGGKIRALKMIEHLQRKHEVHVFSMTRSSHEREGLAMLRAQVSNCTAPQVSRFQTLFSLAFGWLSGLSLSEAYFCPPAVRASISDLLANQKFDLVIAHSSSIGPLVMKSDRKVLMDFCDMDSVKWAIFSEESRGLMRWVYRREARLVNALEQSLASSLEVSSVATPAELQSLRTICPKVSKADWFANGVDSLYFSPLSETGDPLQFCFVGRMDYLPNIDCVEWFVLRCWPSILQRYPQARFIIIGANPADRVKALARAQGVEVTGTVPDVRPYLGRSVAMVAPLRIARGVQNKLLEAMSMGIPVITSRRCAAALDPELATCVLAADQVDEVADACMLLLESARKRRCLSLTGRRVIRNRASWRASLEKLDHLIHELTNNGSIPWRQHA